MGIERFLPKDQIASHRPTMIDRIKNAILRRGDHVDNETPYVEFYNDDKSRRFYFSEWRAENGFKQFNIGLNFKIENGWGGIMKVMTRWSNGEEQLYGLEIDALTDRGSLDMFWFDKNTGGLKRRVGQTSFIRDIKGDEVKKIAGALGFLKVEDLPEYVDFEKTATEFLLRAKKLDFSTPTLYPRVFLDDGKIKEIKVV